MSLDRLAKAIFEKQNPSVLGLDPKLDYIPSFLKNEAFGLYGKTLAGAAEAIERFHKALIDALCDVVPAVKPQCAYYELYGWEGMRALQNTIRYAQEKGLFVIADGKRNDIGTTMQAYAAAYLGTTPVGELQLPAFGADALTVNGYLGSDGISPLTNLCQKEDKGIFVLVKTSNPSSGELQDRLLEDGKSLFETVGLLCEKWGEALPGVYGYSGVGAVVGATYPEELKKLRALLKHTFFLVPGYGAQGGGAADVAGAFDENGLGAVVNASRSLLCAWKKEACAEEDFAQAARREALRMREDIVSHIGAIRLPEKAL